MNKILKDYTCTVEPFLTDTPLKRTPFLSGHLGEASKMYVLSLVHTCEARASATPPVHTHEIVKQVQEQEKGKISFFLFFRLLLLLLHTCEPSLRVPEFCNIQYYNACTCIILIEPYLLQYILCHCHHWYCPVVHYHQTPRYLGKRTAVLHRVYIHNRSTRLADHLCIDK